MKKSDYVLLGIISILLISSMASAFFHKDVRKSPVDTTVDLANNPPTIVAFRPVYDVNPVNLVSGGGGGRFNRFQGVRSMPT